MLDRPLPLTGIGASDSLLWLLLVALLSTMVIKTLTCNFSQDKIYPGHGKQYVRLDAKVPRPPANPQFLCRRNPPERVAFSLRRCLPTSCARGLRPARMRHYANLPPARLRTAQMYNFINAKCASSFHCKWNPRKMAWTQVRWAALLSARRGAPVSLRQLQAP